MTKSIALMKNASLALIFSILDLILYSQNPDSGSQYFTGTQIHYGFIIPHTAAIEPVSNTRPYGFEINFNKLHTSYESWKVFHAYNISGIQAGYYNFQNPKIVGSSFILSVFTEPIIRSNNRYIFSIKGGAGFSYQTKIYDPEKDSLNKFFSTRLSFPLYILARFKYRIAQQTYLTLSGGYNHISNGAIRIPNFGINFPTLSLGLEYFQKPVPEFSKGYVIDRNTKSSNRYLVVQALTGYKVVYSMPTWTFGLSTRFTWQLRTYYALNAGAEFILDGGIKRMIEIQSSELDYKRFSLTAGQDFFLGKVCFTQYLGVYLYSEYKAKSPVYQKYELSYKILPDALIGVFLKAHTSDAELFGFMVSYALKL